MIILQVTPLSQNFWMAGIEAIVLLAVAVLDVVINESNWEDENRRCESADFQFTILTQVMLQHAI